MLKKTQCLSRPIRENQWSALLEPLEASWRLLEPSGVSPGASQTPLEPLLEDTKLCLTIQYCTTLYYTMLYYTIPYYTILYYAMPHLSILY